MKRVFPLIFVLLPGLGWAGIHPHPAPPGLPRNDQWRVEVRENSGASTSEWLPLEVLEATVGAGEPAHRAGFASFDAEFPTTLQVRVTRADGRTAGLRVRPQPETSLVHREKAQLAFQITSPGQFSIELEEDFMANLMLFANPTAASSPPPAAGPRVLYYGPGEHLIGGDGRGALPVTAETREIYLAPGAVVYGRIDFGGREDVMIHGRGILCGSRFEHVRAAERPQLIYIGNSRRIRIEGITLLDAPGWNMHLHQLNDVIVDNIKVISWMRETDGVDPRACQDLLISNSFFRTADDCISIKLGNAHDPESVSQRNRNIAVRNCVLWPDRAHALLIGPEGAASVPGEHITEDVLFEDIDILRTAEANPEFYGALAIMAADGHTIRNVRFENIRVAAIEGGNLIDIRFVNNQYTADYGRMVENVVFRKIRLEGTAPFPSRIQGHAPGQVVRGVRFEDLVLDGNAVTASGPWLDTNAFVQELAFEGGK